MTHNDSEGGLADFFSGDHHDCNTKWARVEALLDSGDSAALGTVWQDFDQTTRRHLAMEEEVLFPAFEAMSGMGQSGPTVVMRQEHQQIRALLDQIAVAIDAGDTEEALDLGDTLHMLIQQHNVKEENMLYPMAENVLGEEWTELRRKLENY
jgi:hemerythrin-like domain-containing protein